VTKPFRLVLSLALATLFAAAAAAQIRPKVTRFGTEAPHSVLYVGNSFFYFNNGIDGLVRGLHDAAFPGKPFSDAMVTIGGASWKWHDIESYFRPNAINAFVFDAQGNVVPNDTSDGNIFDVAVMMD
jgi:hypothetical protein